MRSQLSRAHALLRAALDREFGDRRRWAVLAAPVARSFAGAPLVAVGGALALLGVWGGIALLRARERVSETATPLTLAAVAPAEESRALEPAPAEEREAAPPATVASGLIQNASSTERERAVPPAVLLDQAYYDDYERATFSLEHGLRDDPGLAVTRNDWDVLFESDRLHAQTVVDDQSLLADLGARSLEALDGIALPAKVVESVAVRKGHAYFLWSRDDDTDLACLLLVRAHDRGLSCELDWYATDGTGRAQGSLREDGEGEPLVGLLERLRQEACGRQGFLSEPRVLLQARVGAGGGNPNRVHMNGGLCYVRELSREPLDLSTPIEMDETSRAFFEGGWIPDGVLFHVQRVTWRGLARGDSNGRGWFAVVVGGQKLVACETTAEPIEGSWTGDIVLAHGEEQTTYLGVANSSLGEAHLQGTFEAGRRKAGFGPNKGFFAPHAAPVELAETRRNVLAQPRVVLQARSGAGGGNPNRVDMRGKTSLYVDHVEAAPLDFAVPPDPGDDSRVYFEGGEIPAGRVFVVAGATWQGSSVGDSNGHGELKLVVAGEVLVEESDSAAPHSGTWSGALRIVPGEESRTFLEIANTSSGDVLLSGYFEDAER